MNDLVKETGDTGSTGMDTLDILCILKDIYSPTQIQTNCCQNERYLHHYFSNKLQNIISNGVFKYSIIYNNLIKSSLHPEWPTKKSNKDDRTSNCGKYRYDKTKKEHMVDDRNGTSGFIDFTIGDYNTPEIAIEFITSFGWKREDIIYDMMKLMDSRNPFKKVISYNIIFRKNHIPENTKSFENFKAALSESLSVYKEKLNGYYAKDREYLFWIIEIGVNQTRSWYCSNFKSLIKISPESFIIDDPI
jgi:hypothetical protein